MKSHNKQIRFTDKDIPRLARIATNEAYKRSIENGNGVVIRKDDNMVRVDKDGVVSVIKKLPPLITVKKGTRYIING